MVKDLESEPTLVPGWDLLVERLESQGIAVPPTGALRPQRLPLLKDNAGMYDLDRIRVGTVSIDAWGVWDGDFHHLYQPLLQGHQFFLFEAGSLIFVLVSAGRLAVWTMHDLNLEGAALADIDAINQTWLRMRALLDAAAKQPTDRPDYLLMLSGDIQYGVIDLGEVRRRLEQGTAITDPDYGSLLPEIYVRCDSATEVLAIGSEILGDESLIALLTGADADREPAAFDVVQFGIRLLEAVEYLHAEGMHYIRILPGLSGSGFHWRFAIAPAHIIEQRDHGDFRTLEIDDWDQALSYTSADGPQIGGLIVDENTTVEQIAGALLGLRFYGHYSGADPAYVAWLKDLIAAAKRLGTLPVAYSDYHEGQGIEFGGQLYFPWPPDWRSALTFHPPTPDPALRLSGVPVEVVTESDSWDIRVGQIETVLSYFGNNFTIEVAGADGTKFYVQGQRDADALLLEAVSSEFLPKEARLGPSQVAQMALLGWEAPAIPNCPNFRIIRSEPHDSDIHALAKTLAATFRLVYGVRHDDVWSVSPTEFGTLNGGIADPDLLDVFEDGDWVNWGWKTVSSYATISQAAHAVLVGTMQAGGASVRSGPYLDGSVGPLGGPSVSGVELRTSSGTVFARATAYTFSLRLPAGVASRLWQHASVISTITLAEADQVFGATATGFVELEMMQPEAADSLAVAAWVADVQRLTMTSFAASRE